MKLEEAKEYSRIMMKTFDIKCPNINLRNINYLKAESIKILLQELENSISKDKVKEKIDKIETRINYLKSEISKTLSENAEVGTETEIDLNEEYIYKMEIELEELEHKKKSFKELLEDE